MSIKKKAKKIEESTNPIPILEEIKAELQQKKVNEEEKKPVD